MAWCPEHPCSGRRGYLRLSGWSCLDRHGSVQHAGHVSGIYPNHRLSPGGGLNTVGVAVVASRWAWLKLDVAFQNLHIKLLSKLKKFLATTGGLATENSN